jgi:NCS1 family nucleobase:cation symporter-1
MSEREYAATESVAVEDRKLGFWDMTATWIGANANNGSWYVGGVVAGAAFAGAALVTVVANPIAYLIMAAIGLIGYRVGVSTMALTRPAFGVRGSYLPSLLNATQFIGWTAANTFIAAISISYICKDLFHWAAYQEPGGQWSMLFGILVMSVLHLLSVAAGHRSVRVVERIGVLLILILGVWETWVVLNHVSFHQILEWRPPQKQSLPIGAAMDAMAAFSLGWVPAIAEFTRYGKTRGTATIAPMIGANIGLFWFSFVGIVGAIGTAITTGVYDPNNSDPSTIVSKLGLGVLAMLVIILTSTTANAVNLMAAGISLTNITDRVKPIVALWLVTVVAAVITAVPLFVSSFLDWFINFLDYIGMVFGPVFGILLADYYIVRRQRYDASQLAEVGGAYWYHGGFHYGAIFSWAVSVVFFLVIRQLPLLEHSVGATYPTIVESAILYYLVTKLTRV